MMPSLTVFLPQTKVLLLWLYSPLLYARNGCKTPFNSPEPQPLFNQHLWLYCSFLKKDKTKNHAHNRHSINISEWKNEEIFCKCHPHSLISKHGLGVGNFQPQYSETLQISVRLLFFSSGYLSSHACKWGAWLWKFHALPHCSALLGIRADTGKQEHVSLRETCVASVRKTQTLLWQLVFSPQIHMKNAHWCVVFACFFLCYNQIESVETAELNRLQCYAFCVF